MNLRTIPRSVVVGYVKALRWPVDRGLELLGAGRSTTVDRAEAAARDATGAVLGDDELRADATRRRTAADARDRAATLRAQATEKEAEADRRKQQRSDQADQKRKQAAKRASDRKSQTTKRTASAKRKLAEDEERRKKASEEAAAAADQATADKERRDRLEQLDTEAAALDQREAALTTGDEAERLADAATRAKAARKGP